jgi:hypothetical protein
LIDMADSTLPAKERQWYARLDYAIGKCRELERERLRLMPDVPALKIYDALEKHAGAVATSTRLAIMADLGCKCDRKDDERVFEEAWAEGGC